MVGTAGLEPATPGPPDQCATRLRHAPIMTGHHRPDWCPKGDLNPQALRRCHLKAVRLPFRHSGFVIGAEGGTRTPTPCGGGF